MFPHQSGWVYSRNLGWTLPGGADLQGASASVVLPADPTALSVEPLPLSCQSIPFADRVAEAIARTDSTGANLFSATYGGLAVSPSADWYRFLGRWWLTGAPSRSLARGRGSFDRYGVHSIKTRGPHSFDLAQAIELALCIDVTRVQGPWIRQYTFTTRTGRVVPFGDATDEVVNSVPVAFAAWDLDTSQRLTGVAGPVGAHYRLTGSHGPATSEFLGSLDLPGDAEHLVMVPEAHWAGALAGEAWSYLSQIGRTPHLPLVATGIGCGPPDFGFEPTLRATEPPGLAWLLPRRNTQPQVGSGADMLLESPWSELFAAVPPASHFPATASRESWMRLCVTVVHELMHAGFARLGVASAADVECDGDPVEFASDWEDPTSSIDGAPHFVILVASNETVEQFVFGRPFGFAAEAECTALYS